jgi:hypothetical protein
LLRHAALWGYGMGALLGAYLAFVGVRVVLSMSEPLDVSSVVLTFLPMLAVVGLAFWAQLRASRFLVFLALGVVIAAVLALFSMLNHGFPELSARFAFFHLASVVVVGTFAIYIARGVRGGDTDGAL